MGAAGLGLMSMIPEFDKTEDAFAQYLLPRSTPEQQGMSSSAIRNFLNTVQKSGLEFHSLMILRHGNVIALDPFLDHVRSPTDRGSGGDINIG